MAELLASSSRCECGDVLRVPAPARAGRPTRMSDAARLARGAATRSRSSSLATSSGPSGSDAR